MLRNEGVIMEQLAGMKRDAFHLDRMGIISQESLEKWEKIQKAQQFCQYLLTNGITYDFLVKHEEVRSCLESSDYYRRFEDYLGDDYVVCKNLLLQERKGEKKKYLLITDSMKKVDLASVRNTLGSKKLEFVPEDDMQQVIATTPGNVSLFSLVNDLSGEIDLVIDEELLGATDLAFHPLYNGMSVFLPPQECFKFLSLIGRDAIVTPIAEKEGKQIQKVLSANKN